MSRFRDSKFNRKVGYNMVQLDQVIARSFAVPLLGEWSFLKCSEFYFSLVVKLSYSCETIQYESLEPLIDFLALLVPKLQPKHPKLFAYLLGD